MIVEPNISLPAYFQMMQKDLTIDKSNLIEELGVELEKDQYAPLAARIFAILILNGKLGITFDQLVNDLNASKSSVSTHLEQLQTSNKVRYFTKPGDRKRYFIINPDLMQNVIDELVAKWESQKSIHEKVLRYKTQRNDQMIDDRENHFDLELQQDFLIFLEEATAAIKKLKNKLNQKNSRQTQ